MMEMIPLNTDYLKVQASNQKFSELKHWQKIASNTSNNEEMAKAARGFESMFISMMLKEMKNAMLDNDSEDNGFSFGADTLLDYTDLMFADQLSQTQNGIGLARMIYKHLTGGEELKPIKIIQSKKPTVEQVNKINYQNIQNNTEKSITIETSNIENNNKNIGNSFIERVINRISPYFDYIEEISNQFGVPQKLIKSIITAESGGITNAVSSAGAKGLMQLMDGTAKDMGVRDSFDPFENIFGGTKYISKMLELFDGDLQLALAGYNAGPGNVLKYGTIPPFKETQNYVQRVLKYLDYFE